MTISDQKCRNERRHRLGTILGAASLAIAFAAFGGTGTPTGSALIQPAFAQAYHDDHGHPPPPDDAHRRAEEERLRLERERHDHPHYVPPPPVYAYAPPPPPVYYAPAAPAINLDFIFPLH